MLEELIGSYNFDQNTMLSKYQSAWFFSCQGDSGSAYVLKNTTSQIGIVSFGDGCAQPSKYFIKL